MHDPKDQQCNFRASAAARLAYQAAADRVGMSVGEWMRVVLDHAAGLRELASQLDRASQADLSTARVRKERHGGPYTFHGVLAGAYKGKGASLKATLVHASRDGDTAVCGRVADGNLCDVQEPFPTCKACLRIIHARMTDAEWAELEAKFP